MAEVPALDNTFGAMLIGVIFASVLYGVSCSQVFYYFNHYSKKDGLATKVTVVATLISDTAHQALISHTIYSYLVKGYFKPQQLDEIVWSIVVEVIFNGITAFLVQTFFAVRIWRFSNGSVLLTATLAGFILAEFACVIAYATKAIQMATFPQLVAIRTLSMAVNILAVIGDVLITVVFCILLHRARNKIQRSNTMINMLIAFSVQSGMLTSLCAVASLVAISLSPNTFIYICFYFVLGRLYCNSLLSTLNVRNMIRDKGHNDLGLSLRHISDSTGESRWGVSKMMKPDDTQRVSMPAIEIDVHHSFSKN